MGLSMGWCCLICDWSVDEPANTNSASSFEMVENIEQEQAEQVKNEQVDGMF